MKFLDLFAGIGGFRLGMEMAGHECVGHCEIDKFAEKSYRAMHDVKEGEWYAADIRTVRACDIPRTDVWCFGFPCQDISVAGNQAGFKGNRSSLFFTVTGLLKSINEESRPKYLFIENVKNLLSVNRGYDFARLLVEMDEIGYDAEWEVLNSKDFGVPQNRERVFIIGHLRGQSTREIFPIGDSNEANTDIQGQTANTLTTRTGSANTVGTYIVEGEQYAQEVKCVNTYDEQDKQRNQQDRAYNPKGVMPALTSQLGGRHNILLEDAEVSGVYTNVSEEFKRPPLPNLSRCLKANKHDAGVAIPVLTPDRAEKRQNGRRFKMDGEPMFTLTRQDRHGVLIKEATKKGYAEATEGDSINLSMPNSKTRRGRVGKGVANTLDTSCNQGVIEGYRIRKLTPRECFRLQGFPDEYFVRAAAVNSDNQLYKQAGNSVTVNVVYEIAKRLEE